MGYVTFEIRGSCSYSQVPNQDRDEYFEILLGNKLELSIAQGLFEGNCGELTSQIQTVSGHTEIPAWIYINDSDGTLVIDTEQSSGFVGVLTVQLSLHTEANLSAM